MTSHYLSHNNSVVHYRKWGKGEKLLFCFHGYGKESQGFSMFEERLGNKYTIVAIDMPFHGTTDWKEDLTFKPALLVMFINQIKAALKKQQQAISILGFSMGGRIALYLSQLIPHQIEKLVLVAPDGLHLNIWRTLTTENWAVHRIMGYTINHPRWIMWVLNNLEKGKILHKSMADFARFYLHDKEQRLLLYQRWTAMRKFKPNVSKLKRLVRKNKIEVSMLFGAFDRVIPASGGKKFVKGIEENASIKIIEAGHNLLTEVQVPEIVKLFNH
jgi:pimeloyl-ACP methyl ester carboxylesterase